MEGHKEWIKRGFDDGVFLLVGSLQPNLGGGIVAHNTNLSDLLSRVNDDPFVSENVVSAEILEISPSKADERLKFLLGGFDFDRIARFTQRDIEATIDRAHALPVVKQCQLVQVNRLDLIRTFSAI